MAQNLLILKMDKQDKKDERIEKLNKRKEVRNNLISLLIICLKEV